MPASTQWRYPHRDFSEALLPDGASVRRPAVTVKATGAAMDLVAVVDSGSPISIPDSGVFEDFGIDPEHDDPLYEVPLGFGGTFGRVPVFEVELELLPPPAIRARAVRERRRDRSV